MKKNRKKGMECVCGKYAAYKKNLRFNGYVIDGWKCKYCGEEYHNPEKANKILLLNKLKKKIFHLKLGEIGSNLIIRIPREVGEALDLKNGEIANLGLDEKQRLVLSFSDSKGHDIYFLDSMKKKLIR